MTYSGKSDRFIYLRPLHIVTEFLFSVSSHPISSLPFEDLEPLGLILGVNRVKHLHFEKVHGDSVAVHKP